MSIKITIKAGKATIVKIKEGDRYNVKVEKVNRQVIGGGRVARTEEQDKVSWTERAQGPYARDGYTGVYVSEDTRNNSTRRIARLRGPKGVRHISRQYARYLMEVKEDRYLGPDEEVDHKNGDCMDDSLDNLQVMSYTEHMVKTYGEHHAMGQDGIKHGTDTAYTHNKCRCELCRKAHDMAVKSRKGKETAEARRARNEQKKVWARRKAAQKVAEEEAYQAIIRARTQANSKVEE